MKFTDQMMRIISTESLKRMMFASAAAMMRGDKGSMTEVAFVEAVQAELNRRCA